MTHPIFKLVATSIESAPAAGNSVGALLLTADTGNLYVSRRVGSDFEWLDLADPFAALESGDVANGLETVRLRAASLGEAPDPAMAIGALLRTADGRVYQSIKSAAGTSWVSIEDPAAIDAFVPSLAMTQLSIAMQRLRTTWDFAPSSAPQDATGGPSVWTWSIPEWVERFRFQALGSGAGGCSGETGADGTVRTGGMGGAGGGINEVEIDASTLTTRTLVITVPAGGLGGASVASADGSGLVGLPGASATVECDGQVLCCAFGGGEELELPYLPDRRNPFPGGTGSGNTPGANLVSTTPASARSLRLFQFGSGGAPGGGGGGGIDSANAPIIALPGVSCSDMSRAQLITAGSQAGQAGASAANPIGDLIGGSGGGGASGGGATDGGAGGNGSGGGGGGGGGAAPNGRCSGSGGSGGSARVRIVVTAVG